MLRVGRSGKDDHLRCHGAAGCRARPQRRRADDRPGPPVGAGHGSCRTRQCSCNRGWAERGRQGPRRVPRRDDARHEADLRRGRAEPGQPGEGRRDPGQPILCRRLELVRRNPGVHGDGEAGSAGQAGAQERALGPDHRRHSALAKRAGLPGRPGAPVQLPRRTVHEAAARPGAGPRAPDDGGLRDGDQRDHQADRRSGAPGHEGVRGCVRHPVRRFPPARAAHVRAAAGSAYGVPGGRGTGAGRATGGGVLRGAARARRECRWPGWSSTAPAPAPR